MSDSDTLRRREEDRATRIAAGAFGVSIVAGLGLVAVYWAGGDTQVEGMLLFVAFGGIGTGLGVWARALLREPPLEEPRPTMASAEEERRAFATAYENSLDETRDPRRRRFLTRLLAGAGASLTLALLTPFRSFGPSPRNELFYTAWAQGRRVVTEDGRTLRPADLVVDQILTVFPEGAVGDADAQAALIRTDAARLQLPGGAGGTVDGIVAYSKICTHAGCPVGLYRARAGELLCPCHQSTFDVLHGASVLSGPAGRALPRLPIGVDDEGLLIALGDFDAPVGPSFWNLTRSDGGDGS